MRLSENGDDSQTPTIDDPRNAKYMKPSIPKGTRDFLPDQVLKRKYIFGTIEAVFQKYGYIPIETPTMENLNTLTGKYGEEGDRLLFKVLNNGDYLAKADNEALINRDSQKLTPSISKRGMRYDLTVPFARYVVMHQNEIHFPFKRYQIQPVWRADRPQKGRYQEFYQCDVDVVGSGSLMYEAELVKIFDEVFQKLRVPSVIKINNRKILYGVAEAVGIEDQFIDMTIAIDKLDKIGEQGVLQELAYKGIEGEKSQKIIELLTIKSLNVLEKAFMNCPQGLKGIEELRQFHTYAEYTPFANEVAFDITLARGLNYYTGCIFEVKAKNVEIGSIGGGGRYDDLTGVFGMKDVSGVGISFGAARIFDVMTELDLFPASLANQVQVIFVSFDAKSHEYAYKQVATLRASGIASDIYPEVTKMKKQMKYANDRKIPYVAIIGEQEVENDVISIKDMESGDQEKISIEALIKKLQNNQPTKDTHE